MSICYNAAFGVLTFIFYKYFCSTFKKTLCTYRVIIHSLVLHFIQFGSGFHIFWTPHSLGPHNLNVIQHCGCTIFQEVVMQFKYIAGSINF